MRLYNVHCHIVRGATCILLKKDKNGCPNSTTQDKGWRWLNDRQKYLFLGTTVPDTGNQKGILDGIDISNNLRPKDTKFKDVAKHNVKFELDMYKVPYSDTSAVRALRIAEEARWAIIQGKSDYSAYLLGAMCHYISDPTSYWHTGDKSTQRDSEHNRNHARFENSANRRVRFNHSEGIFEFQSLLNKTDEIIKLNPT